MKGGVCSAKISSSSLWTSPPPTMIITKNDHSSQRDLGDDSSHALDSSPRTAHFYAAHAVSRWRSVCWALSSVAYCPCRGKSFSSQAVGPVPGALDHPTACHPCDPPHPGLAGPLVRLAPRTGHCPTGDVAPLASSGVPPVLALDISSRTSTNSSRTAGTDSSNGA